MLQEDGLKNNQKRTGYFSEKFKNVLERLFCSEHLKLKLYDHHTTGLYSRRNESIYITEKNYFIPKLISYQMLQKTRNFSDPFELISH